MFLLISLVLAAAVSGCGILSPDEPRILGSYDIDIVFDPGLRIPAAYGVIEFDVLKETEIGFPRLSGSASVTAQIGGLTSTVTGLSYARYVEDIGGPQFDPSLSFSIGPESTPWRFTGTWAQGDPDRLIGQHTLLLSDGTELRGTWFARKR